VTSIYIIRHAQAEGNVYRICQGQMNGLLMPNAKYQLEALAKRFENIHLDAVYASDLYRAAMTAKAVADVKGLPVQQTKALREIHFGDLEGCAWGEMQMRYPELEEKFNQKCHDYELPGGETVVKAANRLRDEFLRLAKLHPGQTIAAASHGGALAAFFALADHEDMRDFSMYTYCGNTAVSLIHIDDDGNITVEYRFDTSHLNALPEKYVRAERPKPWHPDVKPIGHFGFDLWYRPVDFASDASLVRRFGEDAWHTVYGDDRFDAGKFVENSKAMLDVCPGSCLFACHGDRVVGLLLLDTRQTDEDGVGHVAFVYLIEPYRHMGLGVQLIGKAVHFYRAMGRTTLRLNVAKSNTAAIALYERLGFERVRSLRKTLSGQYVMKKDIAMKTLS